MKLHLFNPENDLALAADIERYTPPAAARRMALAGELYPLWLADPGDAILVGSQAAVRHASEISERYGLGITAVTSAPEGVEECVPWGWSRYARRRFLDAGVDPAILPSDADLNEIRTLSSRQSSILLCQALGLEPPVMASSPDEALRAIEANETEGRGSFMKMPWSCSGRGVFPTSGMSRELRQRRAADIIRSQGAVVIEPDRRRRVDFAALYELRAGRAEFVALSTFATDSRGAYRGNLVLPDADIIARLGADPTPEVKAMADALTDVIAPRYSGRVGVDMVMTTEGEVYPCIELNLRTTMGHVAAALRPYLPMGTTVGSPSDPLPF